MKKNIIILLIVSALYGEMVAPVSAHTLKIDGSIGVNLHINPDDAPQEKIESSFLIDIQDKSGRFNPNNPANCDCVLTIFRDNVPLKQLPIVSGGTYAQIRYIFPQSGIYKVVVEGKPKGEGIPFQEFHTEFEYFVTSSDAQSVNILEPANGLGAYAPYIALGIGLLIIFMFVW
jgi:hypothetical protein